MMNVVYLCLGKVHKQLLIYHYTSAGIVQTETGREMRGRQIAEKQGQIERLSQNTYRVSSQSGHGFYNVLFTGHKTWERSCPDHTNRGGNCKHIWACKFSLAIRTEVQAEREGTPLTIAPV